MKIDFSQILKNIEGKELKEKKEDSKEDIPIILSKICVEALMATLQDEKSNGEEKLKRYNLAEKIHKAQELEIATEDIVLLKKRVGDVYPTIIVGPAFRMLEGK